MKKVLSLVLALVMVVFGSSLTAFAATETQVSLAGDNLGRGAALLDLTVKSNADGSITSKTSNISFYLPETVKAGEAVTVHVKGSSDGDFRMWLINLNEVTNSDIYQMSQNGFTSGAFDKTFTLTATGDSTEFFFKAPTFDGKINNLNVTYLSVTKAAAADTAAPAATDKKADTAATDKKAAPAATDKAAADTTAKTDAVPKTGDTTNAIAYIGLMAVAAVGFTLTRKKTVNE